jgi:hypothetical protein
MTTTSTTTQADSVYCAECAQRADRTPGQFCNSCGVALSAPPSSDIHPPSANLASTLAGWTARAIPLVARLGAGRGWRVMSVSGSVIFLVWFFFVPWIATVSELAWGVTRKVEYNGISLAVGGALIQLLGGARPIPFWLNLWLVIPEALVVVLVSLLISRRPIAAPIVVVLGLVQLLTALTTWQSFAATLSDGTHLEPQAGLQFSVLGIVLVVGGGSAALASVISSWRKARSSTAEGSV